VVMVLRWLLVTLLRSRAKSKNKDRRSAINHTKNMFNFVFIVLLFVIWAGELQNFALSVAAFAVAIVLAMREFIQCIIGFFYLMSSRAFTVGDWVQIEKQGGEVSQIDYIKTTLLEVDLHTYEYTGKTLIIPNNRLVTNTIKNLNFLKRYANHKFIITRDSSVNPFMFLKEIRQKANEYCQEFIDVATRYNQIIERRLDVIIAGPEPHIHISTTELGDTAVDFTIFCPTEKALEIEQKLTQDFLRLWFAQKEASQHTLAVTDEGAGNENS